MIPLDRCVATTYNFKKGALGALLQKGALGALLQKGALGALLQKGALGALLQKSDMLAPVLFLFFFSLAVFWLWQV